ncbi:hypothetical protein SDC9_87344 [bioreactor metagenome]|uniref:Uncharacterized protein n=1 Tax=bioreactor metagenome TaxID=1076179 RepID=A0A644ZK52_9ZZZZ
MIQGFGDIFVSYNRSGNELRKENDIRTKGQDIPLNRSFFSVDIDTVRHGLEGVKGDAYG